MSHPLHRLILAGVLVVSFTVVACGSTPPASPVVPASPAASDAAAASAEPGVTLAPGDDPTPVPVPDTPLPTEEPEPVPTQAGTTDTAWGTILDVIPAGWPVYPGARPVESDEGAASGAWLAPDGVEVVAPWYRDALAGQGFSNLDLSEPLEDGTRILDVRTDLPECRIQLTFRPAEGSTMIIVLYGAGCAGGDG